MRSVTGHIVGLIGGRTDINVTRASVGQYYRMALNYRLNEFNRHVSGVLPSSSPEATVCSAVSC